MGGKGLLGAALNQFSSRAGGDVSWSQSAAESSDSASGGEQSRVSESSMKCPKEEGGMPASNNALSWNYWAPSPPRPRAPDATGHGCLTARSEEDAIL